MRRSTCFAVAVLVNCLMLLAQVEAPAITPGPAAQDKQDKQDKAKAKVEKGAVRVATKTGHVSNYDESKVKPYTLPDVLKLADGQPVRDAATWFNKRRPEILKLYQT